MRKELPYYTIGNSYGGNQDWFHDPMMKLGGCAAATACDLSIYQALHKNRKHLYPFDLKDFNREAYVQFAMKMKPYLRPRMQGVNRLDIYTEGFQKYLTDVGETQLKLREFSGEQTVEQAMVAVKFQIDNEMPIPCLVLKHKSRNVKFLVWHWFLINGYEEFEDEFFVKIATYSNYHWISLKELWDTGYPQKGGMILVEQ